MANKIQTARQPRFFGIDRNSSIARFWRWWSGELIELVPQSLRQSAGNAGNVLLIEIDAHAIVLRRRVQGVLMEQGRVDTQSGDHASRDIAFQALLGRVRKRKDRVALWLSASQFLSKQIELPLVTEENLRQVLGFEMDRHTPFKTDQVYFDFQVLRRDTQHNRLIVKLVAAPRAAVDASLESLARRNISAQSIYVSSATESDEAAIDLMPLERRIRKSSSLQMTNLALTGLLLALALAAVLIPIWQKRRESIVFLPMVEQAKQQAMATDMLRHEWDKRSADYNFVLEKKLAIPPVVAQLDVLSRIMADDTWVQQFDLKGKELQIQGETASSSKLIALLESSGFLRDASFRSPLTKGMSPNSERFHVGAQVKPLTTSELAALWPPPPPPLTPPVAPVAGGLSAPSTPAAATSAAQGGPVTAVAPLKTGGASAGKTESPQQAPQASKNDGKPQPAAHGVPNPNPPALPPSLPAGASGGKPQDKPAIVPPASGGSR